MRRDREEWSAVGRILTRLGIVRFRLADPRAGDLIKEAVDLLEAEPVGSGAGLRLRAPGRVPGDHRAREEAIEAADRAIALTAELGLPEPAFALHFRGVARTDLGDAEGIDDLEQALRLAIDQGLGRETGVIYGNLTGVIWEQRGPAAAIASAREGIAFCEARGMTELALRMRANQPGPACRPRTDEGCPRGGRVGGRPHPGDRRQGLHRVRECCRRACSPNAERHADATDLDAFLAEVREIGEPSRTATAIVVGIQSLLVEGRVDQARALEADLARLVATTVPSSMPTCFRPRFVPCSSSATSPRAATRWLGQTQHRACRARAGLVASPAGRSGWGPARRGRPLRGGSGRLAGVRKRPRTGLRPSRPGSVPPRARRAGRRGTPAPGARAVHIARVRAGPRSDRGPPLGGGAPDRMTDIDAAIDRLLLAAAALDLPAPLNPAGEAELDALRAAVAPLRLPDDLVRLWRRLQGGPPGMIDRLDLMPVSQAIEFRGIHDGPRALLTIAFESQWSRFWSSTSRRGRRRRRLGGRCRRFRLREVAPSLADLVDSVATAMELGIARPHEVGGFRILDWDERRLGPPESRALAGPPTGQRPDDWLATALARAPGPGSARRGSARRHDDDRRAPRAR